MPDGSRNLRIVFRTDASVQIGTGHVMRCLTLADALAAAGHTCHFICRAHTGHMMETVRERGHEATALPFGKAMPPLPPGLPVHAGWLGDTWENDAEHTASFLDGLLPDWLVVDHYALDRRWEEAVRSRTGRLMVIDDLADRVHVCDLLLDQNLGHTGQDYASLVPAACRLLVGPQYALLRPDFAAFRADSLRRRAQPQLRQLLISLGGVDKDNATGRILEALRECPFPPVMHITVVMGPAAPWLAAVSKQAETMPWPTHVLVNVRDMARIMAASDLAIGAAGSTSWERCCLGVPSLCVVLADNQRSISQALAQTGAIRLLDEALEPSLVRHTISTALEDRDVLRSMSAAAIKIADGTGIQRALTAITETLA